MKQVVLDYKGGETRLVDVPTPVVRPGNLLVHNRCSAVSVGTEKLMIDLARKGLLGKARARPDLVKQVIAKARNEGVMEAYRAAKGRLDTPVPLGYSCAGRVAAVGEGVTGFQVGDPVACFGSGHASHAEVICIPQNLCVAIPAGVGDEEAAFVGPGAIALHAVRLAEPGLGSRIAVIGLGLLGQLAVQILAAAGARVFGVEPDPEKSALARELGADQAQAPGEETARRILEWSGGQGTDAVLVFAASDSSAPMDLAAEVARERAWVVVPGMVDLKLQRRLFYDKELRLVVSRSAGPGVYDVQYEEKGHDYPIPHVRWTARRNMQEFLDLLTRGKVRVEPLISHRFPIDDALEAYQTVSGDDAQRIGVLITYPEAEPAPAQQESVQRQPRPRERRRVGPGVGLVGAGTFARTTLLPLLKGIGGIELRGVATASGLTARHVADKFGFAYAASDYEELLADPEVDALIIATRHHLHASMAAAALAAGKDVLVEKPLATTPGGLDQIVQAHVEGRARLMVGFNRRFAPFSVRARQALEERQSPAVVHIRINAEPVPPDSWVLDTVEGGGRIVGEVCHFVDLVQYLTGSRPVRVYAHPVGGQPSKPSDDGVTATLRLEDGSVASILYVTVGDRAYPRERIEIFWEGKVCVIDNFRRLELVRRGKRRRHRLWNVDRGHRDELEAFFRMVGERTRPWPWRNT